MSNLAKRNDSHTPDTIRDTVSDGLIYMGVGAIVVPFADMLLPLIGTLILAVMMIAGGVAVGVRKNS